MRGTATFLLGALLQATANASAQAGPGGVGAQVGYSRADLVGDNADLVRSREGALTGVYLHAPIGGPLSLRPELIFSLKGGRTEAQVEGGGAAVIDIELAYLELPLLARITGPGRRLRPVLFAGPAAALQIGCDFEFLLPTDSIRATCGEDDLRGVREWDFALVAGGGVEYRHPRTVFALEARYTGGLRSVLDDVDLRNRGFAVLLGITF